MTLLNSFSITSIIHILDVAEENVVSNYKTIRNELKSYNVDLKKKPEIVVLNKSDLLENEEEIKSEKQALQSQLKEEKLILSSTKNMM